MTLTHTGRVAEKLIFLTGGSGDLGRATAELLAQEGATVVSFDLRPPATATDEESIIHRHLDVTNRAATEQAITATVAEFGSPDVLVNAAGIIGPSGLSHTAKEDDFDLLFNINVKGIWLMNSLIVPHMITQGGGSIINFSSIHGITGGKTVPLYHASKGAVRLLSKADAAGLGQHNIRVNSIHPGSINTAMSRSSAEKSPQGPEAYYKQLVANNPLPRQGQPNEIAYGVLYLASDESSFVTGAELVIDGGYTAV